jgi:hypothetical protein
VILLHSWDGRSATTPGLFCWDGGLTNFFPRLTWSFIPSSFFLPCSWDYRCEPPYPAFPNQPFLMQFSWVCSRYVYISTPLRSLQLSLRFQKQPNQKHIKTHLSWVTHIKTFQDDYLKLYSETIRSNQRNQNLGESDPEIHAKFTR